MSAKEIEIGNETWAYEIVGAYTNIFDPDGESALQLRWKATEGEVRAAAYGFGAGLRIGRKAGEVAKLAEIQRVLCIPNISHHALAPASSVNGVVGREVDSEN